MKKLLLFAFLVHVICSASSTAADYEKCPPIISAPSPNGAFDVFEPIMYIWSVQDSVPIDSVAGYELSFANAPNQYTVRVYDPTPGGGTCDWDDVRFISGSVGMYTTDHQCNHEPIYWRVRTVFKNGVRSNWALSYHRVGDFPEVRMPVTITSPEKRTYPRNTILHHYWWPDPAAIEYEVAFNGDLTSAYRFCDCDLAQSQRTTSNYWDVDHQCYHYPTYFHVRAIYPDGEGGEVYGNWAVTYYMVDDSGCEDCDPIATEKSTWGSIKKQAE